MAGWGGRGRLDGGMTAHTAWTPWLCPHAWGLYRRMGALRRAKGRACTRGVWVGPVSFLDGMRRADVVSGRGRKTISRHADFAAMPACVGALLTNGRSLARNRPRLHEGGACVVWRVGKTSSRRAIIAAMPACVGLCRRTGALRHAKGHACTRAERLDGAGRAAHTAWTPWLRPHAWGLCRRMDALWRAKGPACTRAGSVWAGREGRPGFPVRASHPVGSFHRVLRRAGAFGTWSGMGLWGAHPHALRGRGHVGNKVGELARRIRTRSGCGACRQ